MTDRTFTKTEIYAHAEGIFEITSCLPSRGTPEGEAFWSSFDGERSILSEIIADLAFAVEDVAKEDGVSWGDDGDFYLVTEFLAEALVASTLEGEGFTAGHYQWLVREAIRESKGKG